MRIYITGIAGMLGYNIFQSLRDRAKVDGLDVLDIEISGLNYSKMSLLDSEALEKELSKKKPDVLIHTAAMVNVDKCEEEPEAAVQMNTCVTENLARLCDKYHMKMIYISTDAVFDGEKRELYTEEDKVNPINIYAKTKLDGEQAVLQYPNHLVFRTNIYGLNIQDKYSFGEWIYYSLKENKTLNMFTDIDFSPILVTELAEVIYLACKKNLSGLYHACGTGVMSKYDFGVKLKEICQITTGEIKASTSEQAQLKAKRSKHMGMSNQKLCKDLEIHISTPEESIYKFYELIKQRQT